MKEQYWSSLTSAGKCVWSTYWWPYYLFRLPFVYHRWRGYMRLISGSTSTPSLRYLLYACWWLHFTLPEAALWLQSTHTRRSLWLLDLFCVERQTLRTCFFLTLPHREISRRSGQWPLGSLSDSRPHITLFFLATNTSQSAEVYCFLCLLPADQSWS